MTSVTVRKAHMTLASPLRQSRSSSTRRTFHTATYRITSSATPETMAESRKMMGIRSDDHHSRDLSEPKMKPT